MQTTTPPLDVPSDTPWGAIQHRRHIGAGIIEVSTASHGGLWVAPFRWAAIVKQFPGFQSWAGENWLEEDCDYAAAVLVFPELFTPADIWHAVQSTTGKGWLECHDVPAEAARIAAAFGETVKDKWLVGCSGSGPTGSWFTAKHLTTKEWRTFAGNPPAGNGFYDLAELGQETTQR